MIKSDQHSSVVAIIPARGGSKRIPRKNIRPFCGKPIISYSIGTAEESGLFDSVLVSTDDEEISEIARKYGAEVIDRPAGLADDITPTIPVIRHAIGELKDKGRKVKSVCCIYPTSPFVRPKDLIAGYELLKTDKWKFVFSAAQYPYPIQRSFRSLPNNSVSMFYPNHFHSRTQDLEVAYHDADKYYWANCEVWNSCDVMFDENSTFIEVPSYRAQVIDSEEDWVRAELIYQALDNRELE